MSFVILHEPFCEVLLCHVKVLSVRPNNKDGQFVQPEVILLKRHRFLFLYF